MCSLCPLHLADGSYPGPAQEPAQRSPLLAGPQVVSILAASGLAQALSISPSGLDPNSTHPLSATRSMLTLQKGVGNQRMQPLIQTRKTQDTELKRVFHPPFPCENFGFQGQKPIFFTHSCK